ncbi:MAG: DUF1120 domain-containing protein [Pseudomonas sp.]|uniref:DUF1120 domain-containing protein n=1 Tax=Pseudomonas sp. TaxID=306 RepID=UPI003C736ED5
MQKSLSCLIGTLIMAGTTTAHAASSVDLNVRGLITPSACELNFANGGEFDLGKIAVKDLQADSPTDLVEQNAQLTVTCEGSTLVAIESKDNRAGSAYWDGANTFGLGLINGTEKLGNMWVQLRSAVADGAAAYAIHSMDGGLTWATAGYMRDGNLVSAYTGGTVAPIPVQVLVAQMRLSPVIAPASGLTLTSEVPIDGSITLTAKYL